MIQPEGIPISELNKVVSALDANVAPLSRLGQQFVDVGKNTHHAFQGLKHVYHVPKREVLISSTQKIQTNLGDFGPSLPAMSEHLTNLANEVRGKLGTLKDIRTQAYDWHRQKDGNPDWKNDQHMIDWNNKMVNDVHKIVREDIPNLCFQCANAIVALFGGKAWDPKTGLREGQAPPKDEKKNGDPPPDPWGTTEERDKPLWQDVLEFPANVALGVLQVVGETVEGLLTLVPVLPALGSIPGLRDWAKNTFGYDIPNWKDAENAWMGLRNLAVNLQTAPIQLAWWGFDKVSGRDTRPQFVKDLGAQGVGMLKGMVAWDEWSKNPGKAFGMALTNVASTAASFGAGGAIRGAAMAGKFGMASAAVVKVAKVADFASSVKVGIHDAALGAAMKIPKVSTVVDGLSKIPIVGHNFKLQGLPKVEVPTGATPDISAPPTHAGVDAPHARENTPNVDPPTVHNPHVDTSPLPTPDTPSTHRPGSDALSTHTPGTDSPSLRASARDGSHVPDSNAPASHRQGADTPGDHARSTGDRLTPPPVSRLDPGAGTRPPHVEPGTTNTPGTHTEPTSGSTTSGSRTEPTSTSPGPRTDPGSTAPSSRTPEPSTTHKPEPHTPGTTHTPEPQTPRTTHRPESNTPGTTHTPEPNTPSTTHTPEPGTHTPETSGTHTPETHTPETHTPEPGRADEMAPAAKTDPAVTPVMSMHPGVPGHPGTHAAEAPRSPRIGDRLESKKPSIQERREGEPVPRVPRQSLAERLAGKQTSRTERLEGVDPGTPDHTPTDDHTSQDPNTPETPQPTAGHQTQRTPHTSETPGTPETAGTPEAAGTAETPRTPETPDAPGAHRTPETPGAPHAPETPEAPGVQRASESTMSIADRLAGRTDSPGVPREHRPSGSHLDEHAPVREHREPGTTRPAVPRPPQRSLSDILNGVDEPGPIADRTPGHTPERAVPPHRPAAEGVHRPEWQRPETHVPETHVPETHVPETHVPETHVPGSHVPEGHVPESHVPGESRVPGTHVPENHVPGSRVPGAHVPETHVPGSRAPEGRVPGSHVPGGRVSESHVPEGRGPEGHVPEAHVPGAHAPEGHVPEAHTPGAHAPESPTPGTHAPEAHTPDADAPESRVPEREPVTGRPEDYGFEPAGEPRKVISPEGKEKYLEEYRAAAEKWGPETLDDLEQYVGSAANRVNSWLRNPEKGRIAIEQQMPHLVDWMDRMDNLLRDAPSAAEPRTLYRGLQAPERIKTEAAFREWLDETFKLGDDFHTPGFTHTSIAPEIGAAFAKGHGRPYGVVMEIKTPQGLPVGFGRHGEFHEGEYAQPSGFTPRIVGISEGVPFQRIGPHGLIEEPNIVIHLVDDSAPGSALPHAPEQPRIPDHPTTSDQPSTPDPRDQPQNPAAGHPQPDYGPPPPHGVDRRPFGQSLPRQQPPFGEPHQPPPGEQPPPFGQAHPGQQPPFGQPRHGEQAPHGRPHQPEYGQPPHQPEYGQQPQRPDSGQHQPGHPQQQPHGQANPGEQAPHGRPQQPYHREQQAPYEQRQPQSRQPEYPQPGQPKYGRSQEPHHPEEQAPYGQPPQQPAYGQPHYGEQPPHGQPRQAEYGQLQQPHDREQAPYGQPRQPQHGQPRYGEEPLLQPGLESYPPQQPGQAPVHPQQHPHHPGQQPVHPGQQSVHPGQQVPLAEEHRPVGPERSGRGLVGRHEPSQGHLPERGGQPGGSHSSSANSGGAQQAAGRNEPYPVRAPERNEFVTNEAPKLEDAYRRIREAADDVPKVAEAAGLDPELVDVAKRNVFVKTHDVAIGPGDIRHGNFTPLQQIADLWDAATSGRALTRSESNELRSLIAHEVMEAKLIDSGVPYNFADPKLWDDGYYDFSREHAGAHQVAPRSMQSSDGVDLLQHWRRLGLTPPPGGLAADLSNLDEVIRIAREGMGW